MRTAIWLSGLIIAHSINPDTELALFPALVAVALFIMMMGMDVIDTIQNIKIKKED
jgi:hypothetical protein